MSRRARSWRYRIWPGSDSAALQRTVAKDACLSVHPPSFGPWPACVLLATIAPEYVLYLVLLHTTKTYVPEAQSTLSTPN